jgi:hypothetical protein
MLRHPFAMLLVGSAVSCASPIAGDAESIDFAGPAATWQCSSRVELSSLWAELRDRHDANRDGRVTQEEYTRGEARFRNYDRNGDGLLNAWDFPSDTYFNGFNHMIVGRADANEDEQVTWQEWQDFSGSMDINGDGNVARAEVQEVMGGWTNDWPLFLLSFDQDGDGDFDQIDLEHTFRDQDFNGDGTLVGKELGGWQATTVRPEGEPPAVGEIAPDFQLGYASDPGRSFRLIDPQRSRPVALVFGSYT